MTKNKTESYRLQITRSLLDSGWEFKECIPETLWFAEKHHVFHSVRQAYGNKIFVSFIVDPQYDCRKRVLYVRAGVNIPTYFFRSDGQIGELYMNGGRFKEKLSAFIEEINNYRNSVQEKLLERG